MSILFLLLPHSIIIIPVDLQPENDAAQEALAHHACLGPSRQNTHSETVYGALDCYLLTVTASLLNT